MLYHAILTIRIKLSDSIGITINL